MNCLILGANGFIGRNLVKELSLNSDDFITAFDRDEKEWNFNQVKTIAGNFSADFDFDQITENQDIVFHLISTTTPNANKDLCLEIEENVFSTIKLLDSCVKNKVKKVVFISSGGTVYGESDGTSFNELNSTLPICSYGIQKLTIEKYLHYYYHKYNLDYSVIRLSNPYGPGQNPNGAVGAICVFMYKALKNQEITIFGDGTNLRDYIFIGDAIKGIINLSQVKSEEKVFNLGSGYGIDLNEILNHVKILLGKEISVRYEPQRINDLHYSVLDNRKYLSYFPNHEFVCLKDGISLMLDYLKELKLED